jgi:hypothetical protein
MLPLLVLWTPRDAPLSPDIRIYLPHPGAIRMNLKQKELRKKEFGSY